MPNHFAPIENTLDERSAPPQMIRENLVNTLSQKSPKELKLLLDKMGLFYSLNGDTFKSKDGEIKDINSIIKLLKDEIINCRDDEKVRKAYYSVVGNKEGTGDLMSSKNNLPGTQFVVEKLKSKLNKLALLEDFSFQHRRIKQRKDDRNISIENAKLKLKNLIKENDGYSDLYIHSWLEKLNNKRIRKVEPGFMKGSRKRTELKFLDTQNNNVKIHSEYLKQILISTINKLPNNIFVKVYNSFFKTTAKLSKDGLNLIFGKLEEDFKFQGRNIKGREEIKKQIEQKKLDEFNKIESIFNSLDIEYKLSNNHYSYIDLCYLLDYNSYDSSYEFTFERSDLKKIICDFFNREENKIIIRRKIIYKENNREAELRFKCAKDQEEYIDSILDKEGVKYTKIYNKLEETKLSIKESFSNYKGIKDIALEQFEKRLNKYYKDNSIEFKFAFNFKVPGRFFKDKLDDARIAVIVGPQYEGSHCKNTKEGNWVIQLRSKNQSKEELISTFIHEITHLSQKINGSLDYHKHNDKNKYEKWKKEKPSRKDVKYQDYYTKTSHSTLPTEHESVLLEFFECLKRENYKLAIDKAKYHTEYLIPFDRKIFLKKMFQYGVPVDNYKKFKPLFYNSLKEFISSHLDIKNGFTEYGVILDRYLKESRKILKLFNIDTTELDNYLKNYFKENEAQINTYFNWSKDIFNNITKMTKKLNEDFSFQHRNKNKRHDDRKLELIQRLNSINGEGLSERSKKYYLAILRERIVDDFDIIEEYDNYENYKIKMIEEFFNQIEIYFSLEELSKEDINLFLKLIEQTWEISKEENKKRDI